MGLTDLDTQILDFAARAPRTAGAREEAIRANFDMSPVRFHQRLNQLLELPAAWEAYPTLVKRLRRVREHRDDIRRAARTADSN
ncbi:hypothetical protein CMASS_09260 [Corynebacterium massiliense DSM 45435]|mgnify:CR=1 FL=1|uniref:Fis family transcriptional regulator n=2 Tax=Corynebacterium massiliense TaxID=441501 RepID=A0ABY7U9I0_9CORY|nr:hypothetical protein CMASS_09260 [Corynebacterium massiliense DSM 45435]